ncbi:MAG TPA: nuclear transport factor 2 family protein [Dinghuibacter sp.]|uniref:nuclear transport factor 2 family protein n=1 Tax=Dinghuibacter sp. TaxID=2024697 RepID=UPI002BB4FC6F|nr:nuclear transport factor 2 family protein [Dinghuibacter sp.]HTJ13539.1 nuclear transport factor 2 family protein [Dinghuibacter sp.]
MKNNFLTILGLAVVFFAAATPASAQQTDNEVAAIILRADSLFWTGYNTCDIPLMENYFTRDIEFYHDKGGITVGVDSLFRTLRGGMCRDTANYRLRRVAVPNTVHVYTMRRGGLVYGAVIEGDHLFYIKRAGQSEFLDGEARFTHLWLLQDGAWKMARVLSYNHHTPEYVNQRVAVAVPPAVLKSHVGHFKGPQNDVTVAAASDHLVLTMGNKQFSLYPETADRYFMNERDLTFTFTEGKLTVRENGNVAEELSYIVP